MTSITHSASSPSLPSIGLGRFRVGADSKAVRMGLGVAIAAVMAGDVYAVLRSPVSEGAAAGTGASASAATLAEDGAGASGSGYVATNPFSEAAWDAEVSARLAAAQRAAGLGGAAATPAAPVAGAPAPALTAPAVALPTLPAPSAGTLVPPVVAPVSGPTTNQDPPPASEAPPAEAESPLVPVVDVLNEVPVVQDTVAPIVENEVVPVVEPTLAPVTTVTSVVPVPSVTSGLPL